MDPIEYFQQLMNGPYGEHIKIFLIALVVAFLLVWAEDRPKEVVEFDDDTDDPIPTPSSAPLPPEPMPAAFSDASTQFYNEENALIFDALQKEREQVREAESDAKHAQKVAQMKQEQARIKTLEGNMRTKFNL